MPPTARKPSPAPRVEETDLDKPADPEKLAAEGSPVHDEVAEQLKADLESADPEDVTLFEEDDDPLSNVGELVDEDETEEKETKA